MQCTPAYKNGQFKEIFDQGSVEFGPNVKTAISPSDAFTLKSRISGIDLIWIQISLRQRTSLQTEAASNPIAFFSQRDPLWKDKKMGKSGLTIGGIGCAMTSVAMAGVYKMRNLTPGTLNTWLSANSGYTSGGSLYWAKPPSFDPTSGFKYIGSSVNGVSTVKSAANLKSLIDAGYYVVAFSYRFNGNTHWVVIYKYHGCGTNLSDFEYLDPYDLSYTYRAVDGVKVKAGSEIRVYR